MYKGTHKLERGCGGKGGCGGTKPRGTRSGGSKPRPKPKPSVGW